MVTKTDLTTYLESRLQGARDIEVSEVARIPGGASRETWTFDATWREGGKTVERGFIMRRDPTGSLLESDRDVEFRIYQTMAKTDVPVPPMYWIEPSGANLLRPFFVMGRVDGQANGGVLMSPNYPGSREEIAREKASILARIHRADWRALGADDFLGPAPADPAQAEIDRWEGIMRQDMLEPQPVLELALRWLKRNKPKAPAVTIVHGDYRTGNYLFDSANITAILDWEMVHLGDPLEDVGWLRIRAGARARSYRADCVEPRRFYEMYEAAGGFAVDLKSISVLGGAGQREAGGDIPDRRALAGGGQDRRPDPGDDDAHDPRPGARDPVAAGGALMRPDRDEMLASIRRGLVEFVAPEVSTIYGRTELTYALTLLAALSRESEDAVAGLVDENAGLRRLLRSAGKRLAGERSLDRGLVSELAALKPAGKVDLRLSALRAENARLFDLFVRLQTACEESRAPSAAVTSAYRSTMAFLKRRAAAAGGFGPGGR